MQTLGMFTVWFTVILVRSPWIFNLVHKGDFVEMMLEQIFKLELLEKPADCVPPVEAPLGWQRSFDWSLYSWSESLVSVSWDSLGQSEWVSWLLFITGIVHDFIW